MKLSAAKCNAYRARRGLDPLPPLQTYPGRQGITENEWTPDKPCRGLGDVIAKVTHAIGIDRVVKAVAPGGCGCKKRQERLNAAVPFAEDPNG